MSSSASPTLQVWLGLLTNGKFVAVKEIEFGAGAEDTAIAAEIKTELDLMRKCAHMCSARPRVSVGARACVSRCAAVWCQGFPIFSFAHIPGFLPSDYLNLFFQ